ncbi:PREDICTED: ADP-ribose pyrophosphatase, mitochondrial-like, partial [Priapulus caudatus]|uniref:ADP-ribose pyrophosphatase, mitochondrial-like n=1 Tax=Priapulus caudatus TaxID=37621 RepID=A0ABM1EB53_PRICU
MPFNMYDSESGVDRRSYAGRYLVIAGLPLNPHGRTGMTGRGSLGCWGPNHRLHCIVTRWKRDGQEDICLNDGAQVLEFVAVKMQGSQLWELPGGFLSKGERSDMKTAANGFMTNVLGINDDVTKKSLQHAFNHGRVICEGYVDDPRNTDNAWVETKAVNFHYEPEPPFTINNDQTMMTVTWLDLTLEASLRR